MYREFIEEIRNKKSSNADTTYSSRLTVFSDPSRKPYVFVRYITFPLSSIHIRLTRTDTCCSWSLALRNFIPLILTRSLWRFRASFVVLDTWSGLTNPCISSRCLNILFLEENISPQSSHTIDTFFFILSFVNRTKRGWTWNCERQMMCYKNRWSVYFQNLKIWKENPKKKRHHAQKQKKSSIVCAQDAVS